MTDRQFQVGQILYIGSNKKNSVVPVQVKRRTIEETIEGNHVTYFVSTSKSPTPVDLKKVKGQVFVSLEEAQRTMLANAERTAHDFLSKAKRQITLMVNAAAKAGRRFPPIGGQPNPSQTIEEDDLIDLEPLDLSSEETIYAEEAPQQAPPEGIYQDPPPLPPLISQDENVIMVPDPSDKTGKKMIPVKVNSLSMSQKQE